MKTKFFFLLSLFWINSVVFSADFDCNKASSFAEKTICADKTLSQLDDALSRVYKNALTFANRAKQLQTEQKTWLAHVRAVCRDRDCLEVTYNERLNLLSQLNEEQIVKNCQKINAIECANRYFRYKGERISPKIIHQFIPPLSDSGDQIVAINLSDSQRSNEFFVETKTKNNGLVYYSAGKSEFGYLYIGKTTSGVHVISTYDSGEGSGVWRGIIFVTFMLDNGLALTEENSVLKAIQPRLLIKKIGSMNLSDRWEGKISVDGNALFIGKNIGWFAGRDDDALENKTDRTLLIEASY